MTGGDHSARAAGFPTEDEARFSDLFDRFWDGAIGEAETQRQIEVIERHLRLAPGDRVLVLPSGGGRLALALAARGHAVLGIDRCPVAIERCAMLADRNGSAASFRCADLGDPLGEARPTAAVCLGWTGSIEELAAWLAAALNANDRALIEVSPALPSIGLARTLRDAGLVFSSECFELWGPASGQARRAIVAIRV